MRACQRYLYIFTVLYMTRELYLDMPYHQLSQVQTVLVDSLNLWCDIMDMWSQIRTSRGSSPLPVVYNSNSVPASWLCSSLMCPYGGGMGNGCKSLVCLFFFSSILVSETMLQRTCWYYYPRAVMLLPFLASKTCVGTSPVMKRRSV